MLISFFISSGIRSMMTIIKLERVLIEMLQNNGSEAIVLFL